MARRTFTVPAGTVIDGTTIAAPIVRTIDYSPSEMTASQAQKAARRDALSAVRSLYGITPSAAALQRATGRVQKATGRARGGRVPDRLKVEGFRIREPKRKQQGIVSYTTGSERGRAMPNAYARIERMVVAAFERHPGARVAVVVHGKSVKNQSPKRRQKDHPRGFWKKGDVVPGARHWSQSAQVAGPEAWERAYGDPESFAQDMDIDLESVNAVTVIVREG